MITDAYKKELLGLHSKYNWGITAGKYAGDSIIALLKFYPEIKTILDYGCGKGSLKPFIEEAGITGKKWTMYDPGVPKFSNEPTGQYDLVITTDVLEHVEEIMLNKVLANLRSLTGRFLFNEIACSYCGKRFGAGPYKGQDLHINLKVPDIWRQRLNHRDFKLIDSTPILREGRIRYRSIQERIKK